MTEQEIVRVLTELNDGIEPRWERHGEWVMCRCLLAPWTHSGGTDSRPSFGVHITRHRESIYHCFTCHRKGTVPQLVRQIGEFSGEDLADLAEEVEAVGQLGPQLPTYENRDDGQTARLPDPLPDEFWDLYEPAAGHPYLAARGISDEVAENISLFHDPDQERILFPVCDLQGRLYGYTGRATNDRTTPRIRDYHGLPKRLLLLGSELLRPSDRRVLVVEGLFDFAKLVQLGFPCVATMFSGVTQAQARTLREIGLPTYFFFDNDRAGQEGRTAAKRLLDGYVPLMKVRYPRGVKDPGELETREDVLLMLDNARLL